MIREITIEDLPAIVGLGKSLMVESYHSGMTFNDMKVGRLLVECINDDDRMCLVAEKEGKIVGAFIAHITEYYFNHERIACEQALFVDAEHRGREVAGRLTLAFETWAKERNVREIQTGSGAGIEDEKVKKFYEKLGYSTQGYIFKKRV